MTDWRTRASCIGRDWPLHDSTALRPFADERDAVAVCLDCPVRRECDALARAVRPVLGVWAGRVWRGSRGAHHGFPLDQAVHA